MTNPFMFHVLDTPQGAGVHHALCPDRFRGPFGYDDPEAGAKYAHDVKNLIEYATPGRVAGFIAESIQGVGGTMVYPAGYLQEVYKTVREKGGVCIADEVQTGFGRMGTHFWGFESEGVLPDIVTMAKGIGNGAALAAVVTTPEIAKTLAQKIHFNTFGGNPVASAIGKAVLETIDREHIQKNALERGQQFLDGLHKLHAKYPQVIGDVRGRGLMLGVELVKGLNSKEPNNVAAVDVLEHAKDMGLLIGKGGLYGNVLRIKPPMCITPADVDFALQVLDVAFSKVVAH
jgi:alanine-glyoxylate transaminase / (R)-3-amino-2-methylpropionate-pyruvate transaminase